MVTLMGISAGSRNYSDGIPRDAARCHMATARPPTTTPQVGCRGIPCDAMGYHLGCRGMSRDPVVFHAQLPRECSMGTTKSRGTPTWNHVEVGVRGWDWESSELVAGNQIRGISWGLVGTYRERARIRGVFAWESSRGPAWELVGAHENSRGNSRKLVRLAGTTM